MQHKERTRATTTERTERKATIIRLCRVNVHAFECVPFFYYLLCRQTKIQLKFSGKRKPLMDYYHTGKNPGYANALPLGETEKRGLFGRVSSKTANDNYNCIRFQLSLVHCCHCLLFFSFSLFYFFVISIPFSCTVSTSIVCATTNAAVMSHILSSLGLSCTFSFPAK